MFINWKREIINKKGLKELNKEMEVTGINLMALELVVSYCHKGIQDNHDLIEEVENKLAVHIEEDVNPFSTKLDI